MSNYKDIQKKNEKELVALVQDKREELRSARFGSAGATAPDVKAVRTAKKDIARGLTELNARKREQSNKTA